MHLAVPRKSPQCHSYWEWIEDLSRTPLRLLMGLFVVQRVKKLLAGRTSALATGQMLRLYTEFPASLCAFLQYIEGRELKSFPHAACFSSLPLFIARKHLFIVRALFCQPFQKLAIIISHNVDCYFVPMQDHNDFDISSLPYSWSSITFCQSFCQSSTNLRWMGVKRCC